MKHKTAKKILLKSGWQAINIGDIGHTPGALELLRRYLPEVQVTLWPNDLDLGAETMLRREFPEVPIIWGAIGKDGQPDSEDLKKAFAESDFFLHGSGPSLVAEAQTRAWAETTGKPYGVLGITVGSAQQHTDLDEPLLRLLGRADFVYMRDSMSLDMLRKAGVGPALLDFAPDATFAIPLRDDEKALRFMAASGLRTGNFMCVVTRLRYTPYHIIKPGTVWTQEKIRTVEETNERYAETDHAKLRTMITRWVRETGRKVLLCPEMTYQTEMFKPLIYDRLDPDVREQVVMKTDYWLPDEAASTYQRACGVFSVECHSPIIACAMGTPGVYIRQPQDTVKGQMWRDIGLQDCIFEIEKATGDELAEAALRIAADRKQALDRLDAAMAYVRSCFAGAMEKLGTSLGV